MRTLQQQVPLKLALALALVLLLRWKSPSEPLQQEPPSSHSFELPPAVVVVAALRSQDVAANCRTVVEEEDTRHKRQLEAAHTPKEPHFRKPLQPEQSCRRIPPGTATTAGLGTRRAPEEVAVVAPRPWAAPSRKSLPAASPDATAGLPPAPAGLAVEQEDTHEGPPDTRAASVAALHTVAAAAGAGKELHTPTFPS